LMKRLEEIAKARFEAGDVPQLEVFQAELEAARAETDLEVARQQEKVARSQFNALLNEPAETEWEQRDALEQIPAAATPEEIVARSEQANPELQHLAQEARIEEARRRLLEAQRFPHVTAEIGGDFNAPPDFQAGLRGQLA